MMQVSQALQLMRAALQATRRTERLPLARAHARVLAQARHAQVDVPHSDNSARDGYAVRCAELLSLPAEPLRVSQRLPAGALAAPLAPGTVARIFTGAPIPPGADAVVPQEEVEERGGAIRFSSLPQPGAHVRPAAEDIRAGALLFAAGHRLRAQDLGLLAAAGVGEVQVFSPLRVGVLSAGDELLEPGAPLQAGRSYDANRGMITGLVQALGMEVADGGIVADEDRALRESLQSLSARTECVISSGGVSVGERDCVRRVLEEIGVLRLWRIAMKPGRPFAFGEIDGKAFFGLPGNPASVFVCFCVLLRPCLLALQGQSRVDTPWFSARAAFARPAAKREEYLRAHLVAAADGEWEVHPDAHQGSGLLSAAARADCLARVPADVGTRVGDRLQVLPFSSLGI